MEIYSKMLRKRINKTRLIGLLSAMLGVACIFFYYFQIVNSWLCIIVLSYSMAITFTLNSTYQEIKTGKGWGKVNTVFAVIFFIFTLGLIIYAFVSGNIRF